MDSLEYAIVGDPALLKCLAPCKTWIDRYGQSASLTEIVDQWQGAQDRVSERALVFPKKDIFHKREFLLQFGAFVGHTVLPRRQCS